MSIDVQSTPSVPGFQRGSHEPVNIGSLLKPLPEPELELEPKPLRVPSQKARPPPTRKWEPPSSAWQARSHPRMDELCREVDDYFLKHWKFPHVKAEATFLKAGFSRATSFYLPMARHDRIHLACHLLTLLFLLDDLLENMSPAEGMAFNAKLAPIARGDVLPDRSVPAEYMTYDLWENMRKHDKPLADEVLEATFTFLGAPTDRARSSIKYLSQHFAYREKDCGQAVISALMRFAMDLHLSPSELTSLVPLDRNCSKQFSSVNDIYSWEKEARAAQAAQSEHQEGSALCSAVKVLADETGLSTDASKRVLWRMIREWEVAHDELVMEMEQAGCSEAVRDYMKGLEYQMSGNEAWSRTTRRYSDLE